MKHAKKEKNPNKVLIDMVDLFKLPKDLILGNLILTASGQSEIYVENYRSIIEYTSGLVKIQGKNCKVSISGKTLFIEYYTSDEMKIIGQIGEIKYYS